MPLSYLWSFYGIPPTPGSSLTDADITDKNKANASFIPDVDGMYTIRLTVSDGDLASNDDTVVISSTPNVPPNANAGADMTINLGETAVLDGSLSNDPDKGPQPLTYGWRFVSVASGSQIGNEGIKGADTVSPSFVPDVAGTYVLELMVSDGLDFAFDNVAVTVSSQILTLVLPNGGDILPSGGTYAICWKAPKSAVKFDLKYSLNNGIKWIPIATNVTGTSYDWTIPTPTANKTNCLVKVIGYSSFGVQVGEDLSDTTFTVEVIRVLSPNGGEILPAGQVFSITLEINKTADKAVKENLYYKCNEDADWKLITFRYCSVYGNCPLVYPWEVPYVPALKKGCKVKVDLVDSGQNSLGQDTSDGNFKIKP